MSPDKIGRWLGKRWLCPDCGKVLRKPNCRQGNDYYHSVHCYTAMVAVAVVYPA